MCEPLPARMLAQRVVEAAIRSSVGGALDIALTENPPLTTPQPARARDANPLS